MYYTCILSICSTNVHTPGVPCIDKFLFNTEDKKQVTHCRATLKYGANMQSNIQEHEDCFNQASGGPPSHGDPNDNHNTKLSASSMEPQQAYTLPGKKNILCKGSDRYGSRTLQQTLYGQNSNFFAFFAVRPIFWKCLKLILHWTASQHCALTLQPPSYLFVMVVTEQCEFQ